MDDCEDLRVDRTIIVYAVCTCESCIVEVMQTLLVNFNPTCFRDPTTVVSKACLLNFTNLLIGLWGHLLRASLPASKNCHCKNVDNSHSFRCGTSCYLHDIHSLEYKLDLGPCISRRVLFGLVPSNLAHSNGRRSHSRRM